MKKQTNTQESKDLEQLKFTFLRWKRKHRLQFLKGVAVGVAGLVALLVVGLFFFLEGGGQKSVTLPKSGTLPVVQSSKGAKEASKTKKVSNVPPASTSKASRQSLSTAESTPPAVTTPSSAEAATTTEQAPTEQTSVTPSSPSSQTSEMNQDAETTAQSLAKQYEQAGYTVTIQSR